MQQDLPHMLRGLIWKEGQKADRELELGKYGLQCHCQVSVERVAWMQSKGREVFWYFDMYLFEEVK